MAKPATPKKKLTLGPASGWLPAVIAFLCLAMFAIAVLVLLDVNSEPESPQSASVTAVSAQGYAGLRRLLDAQGHVTLLNRMEDTDDVTRGDLEVITLDLPGLYNYPMDFDTSNSSDSVSDDDSSQASDSSDSASSASESTNGVDDGFYPSPDRSKHMLYNPLGNAVLVVAPKWQASPYLKHPRWASDSQIAQDSAIRDMLAELSPMTEIPTPKGAKGKVLRPKVAAGQDVYVEGDTTTIYDNVPYVITHGPAAANLILHGASGEMAVGKVASLQSITAPNLVPVLFGPNGEAVLSRVIVTGGRKATKTPVYLLSDPDLLNNQILSDPRKVVAALSLVDQVAPVQKKPYSVVFNQVFNGQSFDHDLMHALSRPPYLGIPLSLLVLGLGLMWAAFARFGPAREVPVEPPLGRGVKVLADNAARLMAMTLKEVKLGSAYAQLMRDIVLKNRGYLQIQPNTSLDELAEKIGRSHGTTDNYLDLRDRAARIVTVHQLIDVTLRLHAWKTEIERAHI